MKSLTTLRSTSLAILCGFAALFMTSTSVAQVGQSELEYTARLHSDADVFYFFENDRKMVADYLTPHIVRVCVGNSRHLVPLVVEYDDSTTEVSSNDCVRVEAKVVTLEPKEPLPTNVFIKADVDTL